MSSGSKSEVFRSAAGIWDTQTKTWYIGSPITLSRSNTNSWQFPSPRKKPSPGSAFWLTGGFVNQGLYNTQLMRTGSGRFVSVGDALYLYGDGGQQVSKSSEADAMTALLKAVTSANNGVNLAQNFAEGEQTLNMVSKRLRTLAEAAKQLKHGNPAAFAQALNLATMSRRSAAYIKKNGTKDFANLWLEYTYGWKPLVQDSYDAVELYRKGMQETGRFIHSRKGSGGGGKKITGGTGYNALSDHLEGYGSFSGTISNPTVFTLNQVGLLNPASLAWELLPYSFVADWFAPIGNILTSISAGAGLKNVVYSITYEDRKTYLTAGPKMPYWVSRGITRKSVTPLTAALSLPSLLGANLGWQRWTSAYSLFRQRMK